MANTIRPKRSYTAAAVPTAVIAGEMSVNVTDGKIWITNAAATSQILVSSLNRSDHTGTLAISSGGTGATSANAAANAILPSQASNSGKYLTTNGTDTSWGTVSSGSTLPAGSMQMFAGAITQSASAGVVTTTAPSGGWLLCNGDIISRTTYSALFSAIGTAFGAGNGSTTFALPDMRSRVGVGVGTGVSLTARTLGGTVGTESETLTSAQIPAHSHPNTVGSTASSSSNATAGMSGSQTHTHALSESVGRMALGWAGSGGSYAGGVVGNQPQAGTVLTASANATIDHTHAVFITNANNTGGGGSHNNMQPSIGLNFIIKT
jgi:microcystin-dependent protein